MPKLSFQRNSVPKLISGAEVHRLVPKLFRAEVTRAEHRLPPINRQSNRVIFLPSTKMAKTSDQLLFFVRTRQKIKMSNQKENEMVEQSSSSDFDDC